MWQCICNKLTHYMTFPLKCILLITLYSHIYFYLYIFIHIFTYMYICVCIFIHRHMQTCVSTNTHILYIFYTYKHIYIMFIYTEIFKHIQSFSGCFTTMLTRATYRTMLSSRFNLNWFMFPHPVFLPLGINNVLLATSKKDSKNFPLIEGRN